MFLRASPLLVVAMLIANLAHAQNTIDNRNNKEWHVSYAHGETWPMLGFSPRKWGAIRLQIKKVNGDFVARVHLFRVKADGTYELLGWKDNIALTPEGSDNGKRQRIGFKSGDVQTAGGATNPKVKISGIWQRGRSKGNPDSRRMQIKVKEVVLAVKMPAKGPGTADCEEDPDTDVLEEGGEPTGPNDPPPDLP